MRSNRNGLTYEIPTSAVMIICSALLGGHPQLSSSEIREKIETLPTEFYPLEYDRQLYADLASGTGLLQSQKRMIELGELFATYMDNGSEMYLLGESGLMSEEEVQQAQEFCDTGVYVLENRIILEEEAQKLLR